MAPRNGAAARSRFAVLLRVLAPLSLAVLLACAPSSPRDPDPPPDPEAPPSQGPRVEAAEPDRQPAARGESPDSDGAQPESDAVADTILDAHNQYRRRHCAPPLSWSDELAEVADAWAGDLADRGCPLEHSPNDYGENLAAGTSGAVDARRAVDLWYEEVDLYDFDDPGFSYEAGHFTQVVWRSTRELGCGRASCPGIDIWVCNYSPAGNLLDAFSENVLPTTCDDR